MVCRQRHGSHALYGTPISIHTDGPPLSPEEYDYVRWDRRSDISYLWDRFNAAEAREGESSE